MDIYEALVARLKADTAVVALVGSRIYPDEVPQGKLHPAVFYMTVSDIKSHYLTEQSSLESPNIQFTTYADTKDGAAAVAEAIKASLSDFQGTLSGITIQCIRLINELPSSYKQTTGSAGTTTFYTHDLEFEAWYTKE
jgi:hypothetical protein